MHTLDKPFVALFRKLYNSSNTTAFNNTQVEVMSNKDPGEYTQLHTSARRTGSIEGRKHCAGADSSLTSHGTVQSFHDHAQNDFLESTCLIGASKDFFGLDCFNP